MRLGFLGFRAQGPIYPNSMYLVPRYPYRDYVDAGVYIYIYRMSIRDC